MHFAWRHEQPAPLEILFWVCDRAQTPSAPTLTPAWTSTSRPNLLAKQERSCRYRHTQLTLQLSSVLLQWTWYSKNSTVASGFQSSHKASTHHLRSTEIENTLLIKEHLQMCQSEKLYRKHVHTSLSLGLVKVIVLHVCVCVCVCTANVKVCENDWLRYITTCNIHYTAWLH